MEMGFRNPSALGKVVNTGVVCYDRPMVAKWSPSEPQVFIDLYLMGFSAQQIIDKCGIPITAVSFIAWLRRNNVEIRSKGSGKRIQCGRCEEWFNTTQGSQIYCSKCGSKYKDRANILKHGITDEQYQELIDRSGGSCELCGYTPGENATKSLSIDHDHETGLIRGLLCWSCNIAMSYLDNQNWMNKAMLYKNNEHIQPYFIGRGHPDHNGEDYRRNPNYRKEVVCNHG